MPKKKVGYYIEESLEANLDRLASKYEGNKGDLAAAAIWLFLHAERTDKARALREVLGRQADDLFDLAAPITLDDLTDKPKPPGSPQLEKPAVRVPKTGDKAKSKSEAS